jgi:hypothetical protein
MEGQLTVNDSTSTSLATTDQVFVGHFMGAHSLLRDLHVSTVQQGMLEYNAEYAHTVAAVHQSSKTELQLASASHYAGLMAPARETAQALIVGQGDSGAVASFSVQPMACINRAIRLSSTGPSRCCGALLTLRRCSSDPTIQQLQGGPTQ